MLSLKYKIFLFQDTQLDLSSSSSKEKGGEATFFHTMSPICTQATAGFFFPKKCIIQNTIAVIHSKSIRSLCLLTSL